MLKNILKISLAIVAIEVLVYFSLSNLLFNNNKAAIKDTLSSSGINGQLKSLVPDENNIDTKSMFTKYNLITQLRSLLSKVNIAAIKDAPKSDVKSQKIVSLGLIKEPRLLLVPVWVSENKYFKMTNDPVYIKVSNISAGNGTCASVEIKYSGGESQVFDKVNKGGKIYINSNKYFIELLDLKTGGSSKDWTSTGDGAKIVLYESK